MRYYLILALVTALAACAPAQKPVEIQDVPVQEVPSDFDMDGVFDTDDICPDTPMGQMVDVTGCEIDSDNDGIFNTDDLCPDTAPGAQVGEKGCASEIAVQLANGSDIEKIDIAFTPGSITVPLSSHQNIENIAKSIKRTPGMTVTIEGCSGNTGNDPSNVELYDRRANAIRNVLIHYGVEAKSLPNILDCSPSSASKKAR